MWFVIETNNWTQDFSTDRLDSLVWWNTNEQQARRKSTKTSPILWILCLNFHWIHVFLFLFTCTTLLSSNNNHIKSLSHCTGMKSLEFTFVFTMRCHRFQQENYIRSQPTLMKMIHSIEKITSDQKVTIIFFITLICYVEQYWYKPI